MKYPEILLLPLLMLADYFLTVTGRVLRDKKYAQHFKFPHYELNPIWQKDIDQIKWLNIRHLLTTLFFTTCLILLFETDICPDMFIRGSLGAVLVFYVVIVSNHLTNILIFRSVSVVIICMIGGWMIGTSAI